MKSKKINVDIDERAEGVSYEKGRAFEERFAEFMRYELGWSKVRVGAHMPGSGNAKGTSIDVLGERLDQTGIRYKRMWIRWIMASLCLAIGSCVWHIQGWGNNGLWLLIFSLASVFFALIFMLLSDANNKQNAWVECKNLKGKANVNHMAKMLREYNDFRSSRSRDYRFTKVYFASANGYVENALKMAMDSDVTCYQWNGKSFEEVGYWKDKKQE